MRMKHSGIHRRWPLPMGQGSPATRRATFALLCTLSILAQSAAAQVVVLAHPETGANVIVSNEQAPRTKAMQRANNKHPGGGWKPILASSVPGYGAMFCFRPKGGEVQYFIAEGKDEGAAAIIEARSSAAAAAQGTGKTVYICGTWNNRNVHPMEAPESEVPSKRGPSSTVTGVRG